MLVVLYCVERSIRQMKCRVERRPRHRPDERGEATEGKEEKEPRKTGPAAAQ